MPLYIDLHRIPKITIAEAKKAHVADELIQQQYGVKYLQFWCNEQAGSLFCLVEGPDKETVEAVHRIAHGHVACAVVEVDPSYYSLIMGNNVLIDQGLVHSRSGEVDPGYRSIMVASVRTGGKKAATAEAQRSLAKSRGIIQEAATKDHGRPIQITGDDQLVIAFDQATQAWHCATVIHKQLTARNKKEDKTHPTCFRIGLSAGEPLSENGGLIAGALKMAKNLCHIAPENSIMTSSLFSELCGDEMVVPAKARVHGLSAAEEAFFTDVFGIIEKRLFDEDLNIESLVREAGISRPQLYRKILNLTGRSPNDLIRDLRLEKALYLLKRKTGNVSEVAFQVGFNNPSYFAKCFSGKYGYLPSEVHVK
jgi:AraC-like DNA-binding protein